jgi:hypothetical protein
VKALELAAEERSDLVAFMRALTSPQQPVTLPTLPANQPVAASLPGAPAVNVARQ